MIATRNGREALAVLDRADVVICDILMPIMDGFEFLENARRSAAPGSMPPVVLYTATYTKEADKSLALDLGADAFLVKPVDADVLLGTLESVLALHADESASGAPKAGDSADPARPAGAKDPDELDMLRRHRAAVSAKLKKKIRDLEFATLKLAEERLKIDAVIDAMRDAFGLFDASFTLRNANASWKGIVETVPAFGSLPAEIGKSVRNADPDSGDPLVAAIASFSSGGDEDLAREVVEPDGARSFLVRCAKIKTLDRGVVVSIVDVSDIKRTHAALLTASRQNGNLMREIMHRTRNSLQMVVSLLESRRRSMSAADAVLVDDIESHVQALCIVQDLIYARPDLGAIALGPFVDELFMDIYTSKRAEGVRLTLSLDVDDLHVGSSEAMALGLVLADVFGDIVIRRYARAGTGAVTIRATPLAGTGLVELRILDDSPCVDPAPTDAAFEDFAYRVATTQLGGRFRRVSARECVLEFEAAARSLWNRD